MKKSILFIILIVIIAGSLLTFSLMQRGAPKQVTETYRLIPVDANAIIEIKDFFEFSSQLSNTSEFQYLETLIEFPSIKQLLVESQYLDSIANTNKEIQTLLAQALVISIHDIGKNKLGAILFIALPESMKSETLIKTVKAVLDGHAEFHERVYDSHKIYDVQTPKKSNFTFSVIGNNLVLSKKSLLVEDVVRQTKNKVKLSDDADFQEVYQTAGEKEIANIYINFNHLSYLLSPFVKQGILENHSALSHFSSWMELDLSFKNDVLSLNGFALCQDSTNCYLEHIKSQKALSNSFERILPEGTSLFYSQSVSDIVKFQTVRESFLGHVKHPNYFNEKATLFKNKTGQDLTQFIYDITYDEICFSVSNLNQLDIYQNAYLIISTQSSTTTEGKLTDFIKRYAKLTSQDINDYIRTLDMGANHKYLIYHFPIGDWASILFGSFYSAIETNYCTIVDNFVVFGESEIALKEFINDYLLNKTLDKSLNYQEFKKNLSRTSQFNFYVNISKAFPWIISNLNEEYQQKLLPLESSLSRFHEFIIQQSVSDNMIYHNIVLKHRNFQYEAPHTVWESRLDTAIRMKPAIVINHISGEKEIFIQDVNNTVYLINKNGLVLWKVPLDEQIVGEIYQIDAFKNGKLQILFNTASKLFLIDRNGNHVERFPVNLRSKATCGLSVFDYDKTRDYRIIIPCEDKKLYLYNAEGNIVTGWVFEKTEHTVTIPVQHIRNYKKDFIVAHDKYRTYILDRRGETRLQLKRQFSASNNQYYYTKGNTAGKSKITTTDTKGVVYDIFFDGSIDTSFIKKFSPKHDFMYADFNTDGHTDYIFLDKNMLEIYNHSKEKIMEYKFENEIEHAPIYFKFSDTNHKIGVIDNQSNKIYMINSEGSLHKGFPLTGTSPFSISFMDSESGHFNLFVGGKGNFLYNYDVK
jgi:hypothetical protein